MGQITKALGLGSQLEFRGETYTLSPWTYKIQAQFEQYLEEQAIKSVRRFAKILPKDEYDNLMQRALRDVTSGVYTFGSEVVQDALRSMNHLTHLTWLMIRENHPKVPKALVEDMYKEQLEEVLTKVSEANADPMVPGVDAEPAAEQTQAETTPSNPKPPSSTLNESLPSVPAA